MSLGGGGERNWSREKRKAESYITLVVVLKSLQDSLHYVSNIHFHTYLGQFLAVL